ncbi:MAG: DNA-binding response OmpR family regulator [Glaciecola sp.]|jgi:DNA-binding response OmpR family regulator
MLTGQINHSNVYIYSIIGIFIVSLGLLSFAIMLYVAHKKLLLKHESLGIEFDNLNNRKKEILETLNFQQLSVTNIGATIQTVIREEFEQQNKSVFYGNKDGERREFKKHNWHKVSELAERLAYFTLRNHKRNAFYIAVSTKVVFADNEMMLNSILSMKTQQLDLLQQGHSMLHLPKGTLDKILRGILLHASKIADAKTTVSLRCDSCASRFNFSVTAWGGGISSQEIHNINLSGRTNPRFHSAKRAQDNEGDLNLASIYRLITQFGGSVKLVCALNYSTVIYVSMPATFEAFPLYHDHNASAVAPIELANNMTVPVSLNLAERGKQKVLIIDQNDTSQMIVHRALQSNYQCFVCAAPLKSMQLIQDLQPAVILLDQILPDMDPLELLTLLRGNPQTDNIPIVISCGIAAHSFRLSALRLGANCIIEKPLRPTELQLTVAALIEQQRRVVEEIGEKLSEYHRHQLAVPKAATFDNQKDKSFIIHFNKVMDDNFANEEFTREIAARHMSVCLRTLNRRLNEYYAHNFKEHLKKYRLEKAINLLNKGFSINQASFKVGFSSASYFSTCFKAEYGFAPSRLVAQFTSVAK